MKASEAWLRFLVVARGGRSLLLIAQAATAVSTIVTGVLLARGLSLQERGLTSLLAVATSVLPIVGTLGLPDLVLMNPGRSISVGATRLVLLAESTVSICLGLLVYFYAPTLGTIGTLVLVATTIFSCGNIVRLNQLFVARGPASLASLRAAYAISTPLVLAIIYFARGGHLRVLEVLWVWLACEIFVYVVTTYRTRAQEELHVVTGPDIGPGLLIGRGALHAASAIGTVLADRGLILLTAAFGTLSSTAVVSVAQSAAAPVLLPVTALAPALVSEGAIFGKASIRGLTTTRLVLLLSALASLVLALTLPSLAQFLFGEDYASLGSEALLVSLFAFTLAAWRTLVLRLRGAGFPAVAIVADLVAIIVFSGTSLILGGGNGTAHQAIALSVVYVLAGWSVSQVFWSVRGWRSKRSKVDRLIAIKGVVGS